MSVQNPARTFESFEEVVAQAQASSNFKPLWSRFVKTKFYVAKKRESQSAKSDFELLIESGRGTTRSIRVSEYKDKVQGESGAEIVHISGAEIVRGAPSGVGIHLYLASRPLEIASARVEWLKKSLEASRQALLKKKAEASVPHAEVQKLRTKNGDTLPPINAISMPLPSHDPEAVKGWDFRVSAIPVEGTLDHAEENKESSVLEFNFQSLELVPEQPVRKATPQFDVSSLKSRHVAHGGLGFEFFVPAPWQEIRNEKAIKFVDHNSGVIVEVNGRKRDELDLDSWIDLRIPLVTQEMPFMSLSRKSEEMKGRSWNQQIRGKVTEFRGRFNGDDFESIYQVCCIQTAKRLIAVCIRGRESAFEDHRAMLKWMVEGIEAYEHVSKEKQETGVNTYQTSSLRESNFGPAPSPFSLSFSGRIGRLRFIVYSMMSILPMVLVAILAPLLFRDIGLPILIGGLILFLVMIWRPIALRLHDLNLSGKWSLIAFLGPVIASVAQRPDILFFGQVITSLGYFLLLVLPGGLEENEYGQPCPPNPIWVTVLAFSCLVLMVAGNIGYYKFVRDKGGLFATKSTSSSKSGYGFSPINQHFTINFPVMPTEDLSVAEAVKSPGLGESHLYHAEVDKFYYMVQELELDKLPPDKSIALDKFSEFFSARVGGEVINTKKTMLGAFAARAVRIRLPNGYQDFRFLFVGRTLYVLGVQSPKASESGQEAENFFDSFQAN